MSKKNKKWSNRRHKGKSRHIDFWRRNSLEISIVFLLITGIYLLVEQTDVSQNILNFLKNVISFVATIFATIASFVEKWIENTETSDIVGYTLIAIALFLLGYRTRMNLLHNYPNTRECPKCESGLNRVHRKLVHKIIGFIFRIRIKNYRCASSQCDWQGIQISIHRT